jgi:hypothetical protein
MFTYMKLFFVPNYIFNSRDFINNVFNLLTDERQKEK